MISYARTSSGRRGSLCWGDGPERHTLFLMTSTTAHMVATKVGPAPLPPF